MKQAFFWSVSVLHISLIECSYQGLPHGWVSTTLFPQLITEALMAPYTELTRHTLIGFCCHKDSSEWCLANGHWPPNILVHDVARAVWQFQYLWLVHLWKTNVQPPSGRACPEYTDWNLSNLQLAMWRGGRGGTTGDGTDGHQLFLWVCHAPTQENAQLSWACWKVTACWVPAGHLTWNCSIALPWSSALRAKAMAPSKTKS